MSNINALQQAIVSTLKNAISHIEADIYSGQFDGLAARKVLVKTPSVLVDFSAGSVSTKTGTEQIDIDCQFTAYCIDRLPNNLHERGQGAQTLAQEVALNVIFNQWGQVLIGAPDSIKIKPINSPYFIGNGLGVVAVSWTQTIRSGVSVWENTGVKPSSIYIGNAPNVGTGHEADYAQL